MSELNYIGLFLIEKSRQLLRDLIPPLHEISYGNHVTLAFRPSLATVLLMKPFAGKTVPLVVDSLYYDFKGQAVGVKIPAIGLYPGRPHITISTAKGVPPVYSQELINNLAHLLPIERILLYGTIESFPRGTWPEQFVTCSREATWVSHNGKHIQDVTCIDPKEAGMDTKGLK